LTPGGYFKFYCPLFCTTLKSQSGLRFFQSYPFQTDFNTVTGILRLSHKYEVDYLRRRALVHISSGYPTSLSDWDGLRETPPVKKKSWSRPENRAYRIFLIQLVREVNALWILPAAFYGLAGIFTAAAAEIFDDSVYNGVPGELSTEDRKCFVIGHYLQTTRAQEEILRFLYCPLNIVGCVNSSCHPLRLKAMDRIRRKRPISGNYSHLSLWLSRHWNELLGGICSVCMISLKQTHQEARQKFWDDLPRMYGLPPWAELEQMRTAAIGADLEMLA
jgi:hypothetical protein